MRREARYAQLNSRIFIMKTHAKQKGDAVLADKLRKIELDVRKLFESDETPMTKKETE